MARELRERITCTTDDGEHVVVERWATVVTHRPIKGAAETMDGTNHYNTEDGEHVTPNGDGTLRIVQTGEKLTPI
ncbi:hypothetical protein CP157_01128 [Paracoccus marcusii]|uniref:hypothetical protein n=1 Tax=Paracoccus marcusii TaxID=59779 RepID=UPI001C3D2AB7|nr:hypothetical protein [Paracoccus marcusii]QXI63410.1 hypothetical protein CP157_01128 [Paracoccus marcusii]